MDTLTIANLDETTIASLRKLAEKDGRTIEQAAAQMIRSGLAHTDGRTRSERAAAIRAMTPQGVTQTDSTLLIREDRDFGH